MTDRNGVLNVLERWSPMLFLVGGVVLVAFAASLAAIGLMDMSVPRNIFAGVGFTFSFLGLLGLYPRLKDGSPLLARAGAVFAVLGAVGFALTFVLGIADFVEVTLPAWVEAVQLLNIIGIVLGFFLIGTASVRTDAHTAPWHSFIRAGARLRCESRTRSGLGGLDSLVGTVPTRQSAGAGHAIDRILAPCGVRRAREHRATDTAA